VSAWGRTGLKECPYVAPRSRYWLLCHTPDTENTLNAETPKHRCLKGAVYYKPQAAGRLIDDDGVAGCRWIPTRSPMPRWMCSASNRCPSEPPLLGRTPAKVTGYPAISPLKPRAITAAQAPSWKTIQPRRSPKSFLLWWTAQRLLSRPPAAAGFEFIWQNEQRAVRPFNFAF